MLLFNLAEPDWISVACAEQMMCHVVCYVQNTINHNAIIENVKYYLMCLSQDIIVQKSCQFFLWINGKTVPRNLCFKLKVEPIKMSTISIYVTSLST